MGPFNLERSLCQDRAEYDTSDSGLQSLFLSILLFFTPSTVAVNHPPLPSPFHFVRPQKQTRKKKKKSHKELET